MAENSQNQPYTQTVMDTLKFALWADAIAGREKKCFLTVRVLGNNPRINVNLGASGPENNISAAMDSITFIALMNLVKEVADGPSDHREAVINLTGAPHDKRRASTTYVGKDKDGRVYIMIVGQESQSKVKFLFLPNDYHSFVERDGSELDVPKATVRMAHAWADYFKQLIPIENTVNFREPQYGRGNTNGGRSGGSNYNKSGYTTGGYSKDGYSKGQNRNPQPADNFDSDELPM